MPDASNERRIDPRLPGLFDGASAGMTVLDLDWSFLHANPAFCQLIGYTEEQLLGSMHPRDLTLPEDWAVTAEGARQLVDGEISSFSQEKPYLTGDKGTIWCQLTASLVRSPSGLPAYVIATLVDISERKVAEDELARSQSLLDMAGRVAQLGGWSLKMPERELFWTQQVHDIFEVPGAGLDFTKVVAWYEDQPQSKIRTALKACVADGTPFDLVVPSMTAKGRSIWLRVTAEAQRSPDGQVALVQGAVQDVTAAEEANLEKERISQQLTAVMGSITDALFSLDHDYTITYLNEQAEVGVPEGETLLGRNLFAQFPDVKGSALHAAYEQARTERVVVTVEDHHYEAFDQWTDITIYPSQTGLTVYYRDVTERHHAQEQREALLRETQEARSQAQEAQLALAHQAAHDPLTGLYNRREVTRRLDAAAHETFTVLFIDLDGFKKVNDSLGHIAGDQLLVNIAHRLERLVEPCEVLARLGGDEFVILTPKLGAEADALAERVLGDIRNPVEVAGLQIFITTSIGISVAGDDQDSTTALRDADMALYRAKDSGRNRIAHYDEAAHRHVIDQIRVLDQLRSALANDELVLYYQPSFHTPTGRFFGSEALVRWHHPQRGLLPPADFIPAAEDGGLINELGAWCLRDAIRHASRQPARDLPEEHPATWVNVSVQQLTQPGLAQFIAEELAAAGLPGTRLGIEITESALADDTSVVVPELLALSALGVQIAIDDFGTGYSSLSRLRTLPVDVLKIDRSFVRDLDSASGRATVAAIIDLGHALDASVVAEGVETEEQLRILRSFGCDTVCGFLLARPVHPDDIDAVIGTGTDRLRRTLDI
ncbi:sensor domain-containing protein [Nocardioides pacificus]